ncbi:hypothetical protein EJ03DRAFT_135716 [Teratosphaeria nubilosa]|uniref:F-box domain-containing protein n=1 Tax=Teratosphaeria nubilosa TaxID=161662 RepID=A0A6G1L549_9PEZI|nr:hypothetical protein EJ03DRAFT_135716 [Teratosphaeria nubilosa]
MADLPEELLQHICFCLRGRRPHLPSPYSAHLLHKNINLTTLASFSLASKACNRAARASLHYTLDIREARSSRLRPFLSTIIQHPDAVALLHELYTDGIQTERDLERGHAKPSALPAGFLASCKAVVEGLAVSTQLQKRVASGLEKGLQDAELALLLCLCPNLRLWDLVAVHRFDETICMAVIREALQIRRLSASMPLQHLCEAKVSHWDTEGAANMTEVQPILALPAFRTFQGHMVACDQETPLTSPGPLKLRHAYFQESILNAIDFECLLSACPHLETLSVHWGSAVVGRSEIDWIGIGAALRRHGKALRNLTLKPEEAFCSEGLEDVPGPLGDLTALESLRMLSLPLDVLVRQPKDLDNNWLANRLPVSLETLRLTEGAAEDNDVAALDAQLSRIMVDTRFASLSTIRIQCIEDTEGRGSFLEEVQELGWHALESTRFWLVLKKASRT